MNRSKIQRAYLRSVRKVRNLTRPKAVIEKGSLRPFKRASKLYTDIMNLRAAWPPGDLMGLQIALGEFPPYVSRGKGGRHRTKNCTILGRWNQDRSKPYGNPGRSEAARRVFQSMSAWERKLAREIEVGL